MTEERQNMQVDIACVGFGPAMGGFLTTLSKSLVDDSGQPVLQSKAMPGMPLQIMCYERADDIGFGVSGVVTKARSIRESFPDFDCNQVPMTCPVKKEKVVYLLDPVGASQRPAALHVADRLIKTFKFILPYKEHGFELPYIPAFLQKHDGLLLSLGQFNQWVGSNLMASGLMQIWPSMPVSKALIENENVCGLRMADQGVDKTGKPDSGYMPGMDIKAGLTVVGDGPVGPIGQQLDKEFGLPDGNHQRDWAIGMKLVVELPESCTLEPGTVLHTLGYPEPEIFGFMYVYPDRLASLGVFIPSWFDNPVRTAYRYMQHWMLHPYLWRHLEGSTLRSWGAKSLQESGKRGEPYLVGNGYARIGEGSGTTNVLTNSGVDEAWASGVELGKAVVEMAKNDLDFTKENLEKYYVTRRKNSWIEKEAKIAKKARDGFQRSFMLGMFGTALTGLTRGKLNLSVKTKRPHERIPSLEEYYQGKMTKEELEQIVKDTNTSNTPLHDALMDRVGWPKIPFDGKLLISHQDALLMGGKVQAQAGYADHVKFLDPELCEQCSTKVCIEGCSGQAIMPGETNTVPDFDREKCVHCGACLWNCAKARKDDAERSNIEFSAGSGGLHSAEN